MRCACGVSVECIDGKFGVIIVPFSSGGAIEAAAGAAVAAGAAGGPCFERPLPTPLPLLLSVKRLFAADIGYG